MSLGRYDESRAILGQAQAQHAESFSTTLIGYQLAFIRGDQAEMQRLRDKVAGTGDESYLLELACSVKYFQGRCV